MIDKSLCFMLVSLQAEVNTTVSNFGNTLIWCKFISTCQRTLRGFLLVSFLGKLFLLPFRETLL